MFTSAEKILKPSQISKKQNSEGTFFRKAGDAFADGEHEADPPFFKPAVLAKLSVSRPDDPQEREADIMADQVMRMPDQAPAISQNEEEKIRKKEDDNEEQLQPKLAVPIIAIDRKCAHCEKEEKEDAKLQRKIQRQEIQEDDEDAIQPKHNNENQIMLSGERGPPVLVNQTSFAQQLSSSKGSGSAMAPNTQQFMGSRFNADFSGVRIHTGSYAQSLSSSINAQAFTHGNDIYFNSGKYSPDTASGGVLLAHELTHTLQQGSSNRAYRKSISKNMIHRKAIDDMSQRASAVKHATSLEGKIDANKKDKEGNRVGWQHLLEIFKVTFGDDKITTGQSYMPGSVPEKYIKQKHEAKNVDVVDATTTTDRNAVAGTKKGNRDAMPSWCGIFVFWALNKGGIPMPKWKLGQNMIKLNAVRPPGSIPLPGDIAYRGAYSHFAIVAHADANKVTTVNGNTAGEDNLGGQVQTLEHPVKSGWTAFFDPIKIKTGELKQPEAVQQVPRNQRGSAPGSIIGSAVTIIKNETFTHKSSSDNISVVAPNPQKASPQSATTKAEGDLRADADEKAVEHSPRSAKEDPDFQNAKKQINNESHKQKRHHPSSGIVKAETEAASALSPDEQISQDAKEKSTGQIESVSKESLASGKRFSADEFKTKLKELINNVKPTTEEKAKALAKNPPVDDISTSFSSGLAQKQSEVTGPLEEKATSNPSGGMVQKTEVPIPKPRNAPAPKKVNGALSRPKQKTGNEVSWQAESDNIDGAMKKNKLTDDQLTESKEPAFIETYNLKEQAKRKAVESAPQQYRAKESEILETAEAKTATDTMSRLGSLVGKNKKSADDVSSTQGGTETKTEKRQREIKSEIDRIYEGVVKGVKDILQKMVDKVKTDFANSLKAKTDTFNANLRERISNYYGNFRIDDELFGPDPVVVKEDGTTRSLTDHERYRMAFEGAQIDVINPDVYDIFVSEKGKFTDAMDVELDAIAKNVEAGLQSAHNAIVAGETSIKNFKSTLKGQELEYANKLEEEVKVKFENLESSIDDAKNDLLQTLADDYTANLEEMNKSFREIDNELKKSWIDRAIEFIETVGKTIYQLVDLIVSILTRLANIVWQIIKHPIRFFETLVRGLKEGIAQFVGNIGTYLQEAFWTWITGAVPGATIKLSVGSGIEGMFKLVLQVLNLGADDLKKVAAKVLGKDFVDLFDKVVSMVETGVDNSKKMLEPVIILFTQGPGALWAYIKEQISTFIQSSFDRIKETVFFSFVESGLKYIAGFFIPGGGFVKIVKAIVAAFQFIADNMENIRNFFDSIFSSMEDAIAGRTEGVKNKVIMGLKMGVVLALDFLAKLLGLNKIVDAVQKIIKSIREAILRAVEFILIKIRPYVRAVVDKIKALYKKGKDWVKGKADKGKKVVAETGKKIAAKVLSWLGLKKSFKAGDGKSHKVYIGGSEAKPVLMIASNPTAYYTFISSLKVGDNEKEKIKAKSDAVVIAKKIDDKKAEPLNGKDKDEKEKNKAVKIEQVKLLLDDLSKPTSILFGDAALAGEPQIDPTVQSAGYGIKMKAVRLNNRQTIKGSPPTSAGNKSFERLNLRRQAGNPAASYYVKGHLLNETVGGKGEWYNLTPLSRKGNSKHEGEVESLVKAAFNSGAVIEYNVTAIYGYGTNASNIPDDDPHSKEKREIIHEEVNVPKKLNCEAFVLENKDGTWIRNKKQQIVSKEIDNTIEQDAKSYTLSDSAARPTIYLNEADATTISTIEGIDSSLAAKIVLAHQKRKEMTGSGRFSSYYDLSDARKNKAFHRVFTTVGEQEKVEQLIDLKYVKLYKGQSGATTTGEIADTSSL